MNPFKKIRYNAPVTLTFALVSFLVLLLGDYTGGASTARFFCCYKSSWLDVLTYVRLFGHVLGHANLDHFFGNMLLILLLGPMLEEKYGSRRLLLLMTITAFVTGLVHMLFFDSALLGASGIVFMMIILSSMVSFKSGQIPLTMIVVVILYLGQEIVNGIITKDDISQLTHIIGGACGAIFGLTMTNHHKKRR